MTTDIAERAKAYAEHHEIVLMSTGMPETSVYLDGATTPIQCAGRGYRLSALSWAHGEGWGEIEQVVEDDGQLGTVEWQNGEPVRITWRDLTEEELDSVPDEDDEYYPCWHCEGTGEIGGHECSYCDGTGDAKDEDADNE